MWAFLHSLRKNNYIFFSFVLLIKAVEENSLTKYLLWFNFILGSNFICLCFGVW